LVKWRPRDQFLISTERDVRLNDGVLPRIKPLPDGLNNGALFLWQEQRELPSLGLRCCCHVALN
jgi:hypothetical protein